MCALHTLVPRIFSVTLSLVTPLSFSDFIRLKMPVHMQGENMAHSVAYGSASHYKASATRGKTRTFVGLYQFDLIFSMTVVGFFVSVVSQHAT